MILTSYCVFCLQHTVQKECSVEEIISLLYQIREVDPESLQKDPNEVLTVLMECILEECASLPPDVLSFFQDAFTGLFLIFYKHHLN
jgi:hypothetical protein